MTFPLQKPGGWIDDVDAIEDTQITNIDANLASALDGGGGGLYMPSSAIDIAGSGLEMTNCISHRVFADYTLSTDESSIGYRLDTTTINPGPGSIEWTIDVSKDVYILDGPCLVADAPVFTITLNVNEPGLHAPRHGQTIIVRKHVRPSIVPQLDTARLQFAGTNFSGPIGAPNFPYLGFMPGIQGLPGTDYGRYFLWAEFIFDANVNSWHVMGTHERFVYP
jgi:hypothetical protein